MGIWIQDIGSMPCTSSSSRAVPSLRGFSGVQTGVLAVGGCVAFRRSQAELSHSKA